jgi:hypothetical protein
LETHCRNIYKMEHGERSSYYYVSLAVCKLCSMAMEFSASWKSFLLERQTYR